MSLPDLQKPLTLLEQKDVDTAVDVLEQKVAALPAYLGAHVLLAHAYEAQQRWDRALEAWESAHVLMPNSPVVDAGKRRVLRRMDGIEDDEERSPFFGFPLSGAQPTGSAETSSAPRADESAMEEPAAEEEPAGEGEPVDEEGSAPTEEDSELTQLRRQAEREARQGGARPDLADDAPSTDLPSSPQEPSTPEEQVERLDEEGDADDLDRLIDKLESARIEPDPDAEAGAPPPEPNAETESGDAEEVVSETLARIHEGQNDYQKAAHIYAQLADQEPDRADEFRRKADEMREKAGSEGDSDA
jgi:tetratricopeptide (TPR) repeat protein